MKMDNSDLKESIKLVRSSLFEEEEEHFDRIINRLEGYELAYEVILDENERLEGELSKLKSLINQSWGKNAKEVLDTEKVCNDLLHKFGRLTALYIKAVEGDRDFTDFYYYMSEIVYPNGRVNELK